MQIAYHFEHKYGNKLCYVTSKPQREAIQTLTGRLTINSSDITALTFLGLELVHVPQN